MNAWGWTFLAIMLVLFLVFAIRELRWLRRAEATLQELIEQTAALIRQEVADHEDRDGT